MNISVNEPRLTGETILRISLSEDDLELSEEMLKSAANSAIKLLCMVNRINKERFGEAIVKFCHTGKDIYDRT